MRYRSSRRLSRVITWSLLTNEKSLRAYNAERNNLAYEYDTPPPSPSGNGSDRWSIRDYRVHTSRGMNRAMLFLKAIIQAEGEANAPLREAMAIKRERLQAPRAKRAAERATKQRRST
jgi:hypothetical protein